MLPHHKLLRMLTPSLTLEDYAENLRLMIPNQYAQLIALHDGQTIAVSGYWILAKLYCGRYLEIDNFLVHPDFRNKKVGEQMIDSLLQKAKQHDCKVIMLDAYKDNGKAHQFYENHGFVAKGFHFIKKC
jgi:GNAT superfamily N-acetyltransferase